MYTKLKRIAKHREDLTQALKSLQNLVTTLRAEYNLHRRNRAFESLRSQHQQLQTLVPLMRALGGMRQGSEVGKALYVKRYKKLCATMVRSELRDVWGALNLCCIPVPAEKDVTEWELITVAQLLVEAFKQQQALEVRQRQHRLSIIKLLQGLTKQQKEELTRLYTDSPKLGYGQLTITPTMMLDAAVILA